MRTDTQTHKHTHTQTNSQTYTHTHTCKYPYNMQRLRNTKAIEHRLTVVRYFQKMYKLTMSQHKHTHKHAHNFTDQLVTK